MLIGLRRIVGDKSINFFRSRQQPGEVEGNATDEGVLIRLGRGMQPLLVDAAQNKGVDRILCPTRCLQLRDGGTYRLLKRPVRPVVRTFRHPLFKNGNILGFHRLRFAQRSLRHKVVRVLGFNPSDQFAFFGMTGHDGIRLPWALLKGGLFQVEPQVGFPHLRIGPVATKTVAGQDRLNILVEVKMLLR